MQSKRIRQKAEPTIALINVVFLMLIFFMVAGTLSPPLETDLTLVNTRHLEGREPAYALVITAAGDLRYAGASVADPGPYLDTLDDRATARIMPDRDAPALTVLATSRQMRAMGVQRVLIVTEQARQ